MVQRRNFTWLTGEKLLFFWTSDTDPVEYFYGIIRGAASLPVVYSLQGGL